MIVEHEGKLDGTPYTETSRSDLRNAPLSPKDPEHESLFAQS